MKLKQFTLFDLESMEQRFRTNFINSISGFKSVALIGTTDSKSQTNLAIFSSIIHIGANPPLLGFVVRPDSVERHTLENILETKEYTINFINEAIFKSLTQRFFCRLFYSSNDATRNSHLDFKVILCFYFYFAANG